jgi:hypothetical protein
VTGIATRGIATRVLAAAVLVLAAVVLGTHALAGERIARGWFSGEPGGLADLAWQQTECLDRAVADLAPEGAAVHVPAEAGPLFQRLIEAAYLRGPVVARPQDADVVISLTDTPGGGCGGVSPTTLPVPPETEPS